MNTHSLPATSPIIDSHEKAQDTSSNTAGPHQLHRDNHSPSPQTLADHDLYLHDHHRPTAAVRGQSMDTIGFFTHPDPNVIPSVTPHHHHRHNHEITTAVTGPMGRAVQVRAVGSSLSTAENAIMDKKDSLDSRHGPENHVNGLEALHSRADDNPCSLGNAASGRTAKGDTRYGEEQCLKDRGERVEARSRLECPDEDQSEGTPTPLERPDTSAVSRSEGQPNASEHARAGAEGASSPPPSTRLVSKTDDESPGGCRKEEGSVTSTVKSEADDGKEHVLKVKEEATDSFDKLSSFDFSTDTSDGVLTMGSSSDGLAKAVVDVVPSKERSSGSSGGTLSGGPVNPEHHHVCPEEETKTQAVGPGVGVLEDEAHGPHKAGSETSMNDAKDPGKPDGLQTSVGLEANDDNASEIPERATRTSTAQAMESMEAAIDESKYRVTSRMDVEGEPLQAKQKAHSHGQDSHEKDADSSMLDLKPNDTSYAVSMSITTPPRPRQVSTKTNQSGDSGGEPGALMDSAMAVALTPPTRPVISPRRTADPNPVPSDCDLEHQVEFPLRSGSPAPKQSSQTVAVLGGDGHNVPELRVMTSQQQAPSLVTEERAEYMSQALSTMTPSPWNGRKRRRDCGIHSAECDDVAEPASKRHRATQSLESSPKIASDAALEREESPAGSVSTHAARHALKPTSPPVDVLGSGQLVSCQGTDDESEEGEASESDLMSEDDDEPLAPQPPPTPAPTLANEGPIPIPSLPAAPTPEPIRILGPNGYIIQPSHTLGGFHVSDDTFMPAEARITETGHYRFVHRRRDGQRTTLEEGEAFRVAQLGMPAPEEPPDGPGAMVMANQSARNGIVSSALEDIQRLRSGNGLRVDSSTKSSKYSRNPTKEHERLDAATHEQSRRPSAVGRGRKTASGRSSPAAPSHQPTPHATPDPTLASPSSTPTLRSRKGRTATGGPPATTSSTQRDSLGASSEDRSPKPRSTRRIPQKTRFSKSTPATKLFITPSPPLERRESYKSSPVPYSHSSGSSALSLDSSVQPNLTPTPNPRVAVVYSPSQILPGSPTFSGDTNTKPNMDFAPFPSAFPPLLTATAHTKYGKITVASEFGQSGRRIVTTTRYGRDGEEDTGTVKRKIVDVQEEKRKAKMKP